MLDTSLVPLRTTVLASICLEIQDNTYIHLAMSQILSNVWVYRRLWPVRDIILRPLCACTSASRKWFGDVRY